MEKHAPRYQHKEDVPTRDDANSNCADWLYRKGMFTTSEAARYLGISKSTLYKLCSAHEIAYHKPGGKLSYFSKDDLDTFLQRNRVADRHELIRAAEQHMEQKRRLKV